MRTDVSRENRPPPEVPRRLDQEGVMPWSRFPNDLPLWPCWRVVARRVGVKTGAVHAVVIFMWGHVNTAYPRGNLDYFSVEDCAANTDYSVEEVRAIYHALEDTGHIEQAFFTTYWRYQKGREDPTNAERQARFRAKKIAEKARRTAEELGLGVTAPSVMLRDVTVRGEGEKIESSSRVETQSAEALAADPPPITGAADAAAPSGLSTDEIGKLGIAILTSGPGPLGNSTIAVQQISRWRKVVGWEAVGRLLQDAQERGWSGQGAFERIDQAVRGAVQGLVLPLGPVAITPQTSPAPEPARKTA